MARLLLSLGVAAVMAAAIYGAAASLGGISSQNLAAEDAQMVGCDPDGVSVTYGLVDAPGGHRIYVASVDGIADPCIGRSFTISFHGDAGFIASAQATVGPGGAPDNRSVLLNFVTPLPRVHDVEFVNLLAS